MNSPSVIEQSSVYSLSTNSQKDFFFSRRDTLRLRLFSFASGFVDRAPRTYLKPHLFALTQTAPVCSFLFKKCSFLAVCIHPRHLLGQTHATPTTTSTPRTHMLETTSHTRSLKSQVSSKNDSISLQNPRLVARGGQRHCVWKFWAFAR